MGDAPREGVVVAEVVLTVVADVIVFWWCVVRGVGELVVGWVGAPE